MGLPRRCAAGRWTVLHGIAHQESASQSPAGPRTRIRSGPPCASPLDERCIMLRISRVSSERLARFMTDEQRLQEYIETIAQWVLESEHLVAFTGAGISTDSGIPDFR